MRRSGFLLPRVVLPLVLAVCLAAPGRAWANNLCSEVGASVAPNTVDQWWYYGFTINVTNNSAQALTLTTDTKFRIIGTSPHIYEAPLKLETTVAEGDTAALEFSRVRVCGCLDPGTYNPVLVLSGHDAGSNPFTETLTTTSNPVSVQAFTLVLGGFGISYSSQEMVATPNGALFSIAVVSSCNAPWGCSVGSDGSPYFDILQEDGSPLPAEYSEIMLSKAILLWAKPKPGVPIVMGKRYDAAIDFDKHPPYCPLNPPGTSVGARFDPHMRFDTDTNLSLTSASADVTDFVGGSPFHVQASVSNPKEYGVSIDYAADKTKLKVVHDGLDVTDQFTITSQPPPTGVGSLGSGTVTFLVELNHAVPAGTYTIYPTIGSCCGAYDGANIITLTGSVDGEHTTPQVACSVNIHPVVELDLTGSGTGIVIVNGTERAFPWSGAFAPGSSVTLEAVPATATGWVFGGWSGDLSGSTNPAVLVMDGNKAVAAQFVPRSDVHQVIEAWRGGGFNQPWSVSADPADGSCWVADTYNNQVVHLAADGTELWRGGGFYRPSCVSVNPTDGSCWVADYTHTQVVHLAQDGTELFRSGQFYYPHSVSVNSSDGSCWVADYHNNRVVHLAEDGTVLWQGGGFNYPLSVSVNPSDGSCWVVDYGNNQVAHLADDGSELWRGGGFTHPYCVSVNPSDGSCWVADTNNRQVVHLAEDGSELWRGGFSWPMRVCVNPNDNSCWVIDYSEVVHLADDGVQLWRGGGLNLPLSVSVNPTDGSCWVADTRNNQVVHLVILGVPGIPSSLTATAVSNGQINLTWHDNSTNESGFKIERSLTGVWGSWSEIALVGANVTSYQNIGLAPATRYYYRVRAYNGVGYSAYSNTANAKTYLLAAPSSLAATVVSDTHINLSWTQTTIGETGFAIERAPTSGGTWVQIKTVGANVVTYANTGLTANTTYFYRVRAYKAGIGYSAYSNVALAHTYLLAAPSNLVATVVSDTQINLSWTQTAIGETGFAIERAPTSGGTWVQIATVPADSTTYQNIGLTANTTYYYRVRAYKAGVGYSAYSNVVSATTS